MKKKTAVRLIILVLVVMLIALTVHKAYPAEANKAKSTKSIAALKKAKAYIESIKNAQPDLEITNVKFVVDNDGRIYMKESAEATIKLQDLKFEGPVKFDANVYVVPQPKKRKLYKGAGLAYLALPEVHEDKSKLTKGELALSYKIAHKVAWGLELVINTKRYGAGVSRKVSDNSKIIGGATWQYGKEINASNTIPFLGFGFEF